MKKRCKRLISFIMALTIACSSQAVVLAAENEEVSAVKTEETVANQTEAESRAANLINLTGYYKYESATTVNLPLTVTEPGGYLYFTVLTEGPVRMTMYSNGVQVATVYAQKPLNKGEVQWIPINFDRTTNNCWAPGNFTIKVEVLFNYKCTFAVFMSEIELP